MKAKRIIVCALFTAIIALMAPFSVLIGPVPVTFVLFPLALCAFLWGSKLAAISVLVYIGIGAVGLPVFSNFRGGIGAIASPTGGFILSYVFIVLILGLCCEKKSKGVAAMLNAASLFVCYAFGIIWYMLLTKADFLTALVVCVLPFIPFDVIKLFAAYRVAKIMKIKMKMQM